MLKISQDSSKPILLEKKYDHNIDLSLSSSKDLVEGKIVFITASKVFLNFGTKNLIEVSLKDYTKILIQTYLILKNSYLMVRRPNIKTTLFKKELKSWLKNKIKVGETINLKLSTIDSIQNTTKINYEDSFNSLKTNKLFYELEH